MDRTPTASARGRGSLVRRLTAVIAGGLLALGAPLAVVAPAHAAPDFAVTSPTDESTVKGPEVTFTGTAPDGTVNVVRNSVIACSAEVDADGNWSCAVTFAQSTAENVLVMWSSPSEQSDQQSVAVLVLNPPTVAGGADPVVATSADGTGTDLGVTGAYPSQDTVVTVAVDGTPICTNDAPSGSLPCTVQDALAPGDHTVSAVQTFQGAASDPTTLTLTVPTPAAPPAPDPVVTPSVPTPTATPVSVPEILPTQTPSPTAPGFLTFSFSIIGTDGRDLAGEELHPGDDLVLLVTGLPAGAAVSAEVHSTPERLGSATAGRAGQLRMPVTLPADLETGAHTIRLAATSLAGERGASSARIDVEPAALTTLAVPTASPNASASSEQAAPVATGSSSGSAGRASASGTGAAASGAPVDVLQQVPALSLTPVQSLPLTPVVVSVVTGATIVFLLLVAMPAELLENTVSRNYTSWFGRFHSIVAAIVRPRLSLRWQRLGLVAVLLATSTLLLQLADPAPLLSLDSLRLLISALGSILVVNLGVKLVVARIAQRAFDLPTQLRPLPATLLIVAASVLVSRTAGLEPAFLFGMVLGTTTLRNPTDREEGLLSLLTLGLRMVVGLAAWGAFSALPVEGTAALAIGRDVLAGITISSAATLVISALPLRAMEGDGLFRWNRWVWLGTYAASFALFMLVIVPKPDNWGVASGGLFGWLPWFIGFALFSVAVWALASRAERRRTGRRVRRRPVIT